MFLHQLNNEEKEAFLSLAVHAAESNGVFAVEERSMIEAYCKEMGIVFFDASNIWSLEEVMLQFKQATDHIKKVVFFEILGLVYADNEYDEKEKAFLSEFADKIGLSKSDVEKQAGLILQYMQLINDIADAV